MQHPGREARGVALAFDAHPRHSDLRECAERGAVEWRATGREDDHQRFVIHRPHANAAGVSDITVSLQGGAIRRAASDLGVDLRPLQLPGEVHVDHLGLRVEIVDLPPALAVPVAVCFTPPNGRCASAPIVGAFTYVMPVSSSPMAPKAAFTSRV